MNASCGHCGSTVMPYRRYILQFGPTATCQHCGQRVRLRGYGALLAGSLLMLGAFVALMLLLHSGVAKAVVAVALVAVAFALDWWSWHALRWIPLASNGEPPSSNQQAP
jgi:DNA-directed RNA polymerase subunit RPC12/RpoP